MDHTYICYDLSDVHSTIGWHTLKKLVPEACTEQNAALFGASFWYKFLERCVTPNSMIQWGWCREEGRGVGTDTFKHSRQANRTILVTCTGASFWYKFFCTSFLSVVSPLLLHKYDQNRTTFRSITRPADNDGYHTKLGDQWERHIESCDWQCRPNCTDVVRPSLVQFFRTFLQLLQLALTLLWPFRVVFQWSHLLEYTNFRHASAGLLMTVTVTA